MRKVHGHNWQPDQQHQRPLQGRLRRRGLQLHLQRRDSAKHTARTLPRQYTGSECHKGAWCSACDSNGLLVVMNKCANMMRCIHTDPHPCVVWTQAAVRKGPGWRLADDRQAFMLQQCSVCAAVGAAVKQATAMSHHQWPVQRMNHHHRARENAYRRCSGHNSHAIGSACVTVVARPACMPPTGTAPCPARHAKARKMLARSGRYITAMYTVCQQTWNGRGHSRGALAPQEADGPTSPSLPALVLG